MRVVSLLASGTEIVCALGVGDWLVGRSHECDNPAWVRSLPGLSEPAFDVTVSSKAIDAEVNRRIRSGEPLYLLENATIAELAPDLIITQAHCEVCAVSPGDLERSGCLVSGAAQVMALTAGSLEGIFDGIGRVPPADANFPSDRGASLFLGKGFTGVRFGVITAIVVRSGKLGFRFGNSGGLSSFKVRLPVTE